MKFKMKKLFEIIKKRMLNLWGYEFKGSVRTINNLESYVYEKTKYNADIINTALKIENISS